MESSRDIIILIALFLSLYFEVFMLITYIEHRKSLKNRLRDVGMAHTDLPAVTVIVPCYNEERTVGKTVASLLALDYPQDRLSIVLVNDGSTDGTAQTLETFRGHPNIHVLHKENGGKHTALNMAIEHCRTPFVGCLDADSYATPDALMRIIRRFEDETVMAVVPSLHIHNPRTIIQRLQKVEYILGVFLRSILAELNALYVTPGPFSIFRRSVFDQIGYYKKAHNTEDMEMALRMQHAGMKIANAHDAVIYTSSPHTVPTLYKQRVRWTSGFLHNVRDYRSMIFDRRFGYMGGFVLPFMVISTAAVLFVVASILYDVGLSIHTKIISWQTLGSRAFEWSWPSFDWFYLHTSPIMFGGIVALIIIFTIIFLGSRLSRGDSPRLLDLACYTFLYSLIAPFWIIRSVANVTLGRQATWR